MNDRKDSHTHPDNVSHRPINLTRRIEGSESKSAMGYSSLETHTPTSALHQTPRDCGSPPIRLSERESSAFAYWISFEVFLLLVFCFSCFLVTLKVHIDFRDVFFFGMVTLQAQAGAGLFE